MKRRVPFLSTCGKYSVLPLSNGQEALIDTEDVEKVLPHSWCCIPKAHNEFRVCTRTKKKVVYLHRLLLGAPQSLEVDHINGNSLDNRKDNLRLATHRQNLKNLRTKSEYKGVRRHSKTSWAANIWCDYKKFYLGVFPTAELAAIAYNNKAIELHGEFARLNGGM